MRKAIGRYGLLGATLASALVLTLPAWAESEADRARAMAERFATGKELETLPSGARRVVPAAQPEPAEEQRLSEEIDMLARARAEAEARREELIRAREAADSAEQAATAAGTAKNTAEQRRTAEERQRAEAALRAAEANRKAEEERRIAEDRRRAEEARLASEARAKAEEARQAEIQRQAEDERRIAEARAKAEAAQQAADARAKADEEHRKGEQRAAEEAQQAAMEAEREAEADRITEALRKAREARLPRGGVEDASATTTRSRDVIDDRPEPRDQGYNRSERREPAAPRTADAAPDRAPDEFRRDGRPDLYRSDRGQADGMRNSTRVAILLVLTPGNYGIRRNNKTADPLLCGEQGCYVSAGAGLPAELLRKHRALGVGRTLGSRAGACSNSLGCIFRDVDLVAYPAFVQPVDMHVIKHDRRQPQMLHETSACRLVADRLACSAIQGPDYTMWVVPEELAEQAGPTALERALENGLADAEPAAAVAQRPDRRW